MVIDDLLAHTPPKFAKFLLTKGSLTALLERQAAKPLMVEVLVEGHRPLTRQQKIHLGLPINRPQMAWVRIVKLHGDGDGAWVLASSVFPLTSLTHTLKRLRHLGSTPIGYILFKNHRRHPYRRSYYNNATGVGRCTVYEFDGRPILIDELFLPAFMNALAE